MLLIGTIMVENTRKLYGIYMFSMPPVVTNADKILAKKGKLHYA